MALANLNLKGTKSLVVDPDASIRHALGKRLADWGADVVEAESGARGLAELAHAREAGAPFGLVFVASAMSPTTGFEVAEILKHHPAELARTVLMLGADHIVEDGARARQLGVAAHVAKPLSLSEIIRAISMVLSADGAAQQSGTRLKPKRSWILLAEDSSDVAWILRTQIEGSDYKVDVAPDGAVAVNLFRLGEYDLVLMDIQMPNFDGYWATREIRAWERQNRLERTPIVALTAFAQQEDAQKSFRAGLDGHLVKPIDKDKLLSAIGRHLKRK
jgi:CheY-like chemotaxis protein